MVGISEIRLRDCFMKKGMNVGELARAAGVSPSHLSRLLSKGGFCRFNTVHKLAAALECDPHDFMVRFDFRG